MDLFEENIGYTEIFLNLRELRAEADSLDVDSLIDELNSILYIIEDEEANEKIHHLKFKNEADVDLTEDEVKFLRDVFVTHYAGFAYFVDDEEDEDDD